MGKKLNGDLIIDKNEVGILLHPIIIPGQKRHVLRRLSSEEWPFHYFTATTDMKDFIGNVRATNGSVCSVEGVYRGKMQTLRNIKIYSDFKINERVMVTEHVDINGRFGFIATKKRVLFGDLNFINIGWSNEEGSRRLVIDIYTGEAKEMKGALVPPNARLTR